MMSAAVSPLIAQPQIAGANFLNLLIVDDERSIREACREVAISLGFIAHVADSAEHAFRRLHRAVPRHHDDQSFRTLRFDLAERFKAARSRKAQVKQDGIDGLGLQQAKGVLCGISNMGHEARCLRIRYEALQY